MVKKIPSKLLGNTSGLESDAPETVQCLGFDGEHLVVRSAFRKGVQRILPAKLDPATLLAICGATWLHEKFPAKSKGPSSAWGFSRTDAVQYLIRRCQEVGVYNPPVERPEGVYLSADGQGLIVNTGTEVFRNDGYPVDEPDLNWEYTQVGKGLGISSFTTAATPKDVKEFDALFKCWKYRNPCDAMLIQGWWAMTVIAAVLSCRPPLCLTGGKGNGKTTLERVMGNLSGPAALRVSDGSSTAVGIGQALQGRAIPVYIDEAEQDAHGTVHGIVVMARTAYSDSGEGRLVGTGSGRARAVRVVSPFMVTCIRPPLFHESDASRWVIAEIIGLKSAALRKPSKLLDKPYAEALGARLRKLVLDRWPVFKASLAEFRVALIRQLNDGRQADTLAPLLAGFWILHHDLPPRAAEAGQMVRKLGGSTLEQQELVADEEDCLRTLLTKSVSGQLIGERGRVSLVEVIRCAYQDAALANTQLQRLGMRVIRKGDGTTVLAVAVSAVHRELLTLYSNTRFAGGGWAPVLRRLKGAVSSTQKILGVATKVIEVPLPDYLVGDITPDPMDKAA